MIYKLLLVWFLATTVLIAAGLLWVAATELHWGWALFVVWMLVPAVLMLLEPFRRWKP